MLSLFFQLFCLFSIFDYILVQYLNLNGVYFLLHFIHNMVITYFTFPNIQAIFTNNGHGDSRLHGNVIPFVYALHTYHIFSYFPYLTKSDWLHHFYSMFIAVPLTALFFEDEMQYLGMCLFFTTGLPGGINYLLCFLYKNNWIVTKQKQIEYNALIQSWLRCPGITVTSGLVLQHVLKHSVFLSIEYLIGLAIFSILFWNGIFFQNQVLQTYYSKYKL